MRFLNAFFVVIFTISAILQYNDPDPLLWIVIYSYGSLVCLLAILGKDHNILHYAGILVFLSYALYLFFIPNGVLTWLTDYKTEEITGSMSVEKPWIEYTREFFGLLILSFALILNLVFQKDKHQQKLNAVQ